MDQIVSMISSLNFSIQDDLDFGVILYVLLIFIVKTNYVRNDVVCMRKI